MKKKQISKDPLDARSSLEFERLLAFEMGYVPTTRVTKQEAFKGRPDTLSVLLQEAVGTRELITSDQLPAQMAP